MTRFIPIQEGRAWCLYDTANNITWPVPAYADKVSAQGMCDIHNATEEGAGLQRKARLRRRHEETRRFANPTPGWRTSSDG